MYKKCAFQSPKVHQWNVHILLWRTWSIFLTNTLLLLSGMIHELVSILSTRRSSADGAAVASKVRDISFRLKNVIQNYANPVYGVATICHQVRWLRWGHPSPFHTATSLLIWYKMFCVRDISYRLIWMEFINMFSGYAQSGTHSRFHWWIIVGFNIQPFCSDVCGDHRRPQTLAEMCRNMGIRYGFRSVAARVKYPGFM